MKKVMILGAGIYQVPLIKKAKEMGLHTIVVSIPGNYPGFEIADEICYEDTTDAERILQVAKEKKIDGIVTAGTDVAVITIGTVCDAMGLRGLSKEAAEIASNKMQMKEAYEANDVRTAKFRYTKLDINDVKEKAGYLTFPLIFKAVDSSGSRGIIRVDSVDEFENALRIVEEVTKKDYFIIEEFIEGEEFGAQAFVYNGELKFIMPHGDYVFKGNTGVPIGHWAPFELSDDVIEDAKEQLRKAIKAMKLDNCAINADFIMSNGKTYVLELGGRAGATCLAEMVSIYYGYDYYEKILRACLGEDIDFPTDQSNPNAAMLLMSDVTGEIQSITNSNPQNDNIYQIQYDYKVGDSVRKFAVGPDRIGNVIVTGKTVTDAKHLVEDICDKICIEVK